MQPARPAECGRGHCAQEHLRRQRREAKRPKRVLLPLVIPETGILDLFVRLVHVHLGPCSSSQITNALFDFSPLVVAFLFYRTLWCVERKRVGAAAAGELREFASYVKQCTRRGEM